MYIPARNEKNQRV